ncbi:MAG TPA: altronate dehydratase family protein [Candidatus Dormibacteraeota bacterium]|nr:altronate dehydratase family protein [Candidatus Dormibacteraeota bacterium]
MRSRLLQLDSRDNVLIALSDLKKDEELSLGNQSYALVSDVPAKHKFAAHDLAPGDPVFMYGVVVGKAVKAIPRGERITTLNVRHDAAAFHENGNAYCWRAPDVSKWRQRTFSGFHRSDGQVGTRNYWLVIPLVFCENRNLDVLKQAFQEELGFSVPQIYRRHVAELAGLYREGRTDEIRKHSFAAAPTISVAKPKLFGNVDGIKFLVHEGGCGGTREDANNLCGLLAGYIHHPNVAGATVLSLGCQNAQIPILRQEIERRNPKFDKPLFVFEQQKCASEAAMLSEAIRETFLGLMEADTVSRKPAPLSHLSAALKCGGSDGFSGISANPAIGHVADLLVALGGRGILAEFPELCGVEQQLINRCVDKNVSQRFIQFMRDYAARAKAVRSGFEMNPSPGNIRDGLITDAMKSAGAAKKGGTSPVTGVLDYPEYSSTAGLNLLCTPGNDVECVTAQVGSGANVVLFTTGLGTPTGNPIAPVIKISTNSDLSRRMHDIIDIDTGPIISGDASIKEMGETILDFVIQVAGGERKTKAELLAQDDFIPWKRGVSL